VVAKTCCRSDGKRKEIGTLSGPQRKCRLIRQAGRAVPMGGHLAEKVIEREQKDVPQVKKVWGVLGG